MSELPNPQSANRVFQRFVTGRLELGDDFFGKKLAVAEQHLVNWKRMTGRDDLPTRVIELGTGWHPVVPMALALRGVGSVCTVDLQPLFGDEQVVEVLEALQVHLDGSSDAYEQSARSRVALALSMEPGDARRRLSAIGVESRIADATNLDIDTGSVDLVTSNNTLEHIPAEALSRILRELRRVIHPAGASSHLIDLADHYAGFDEKLSPYHFLRFSERRWRLFNNELQYQNRLRCSQYLTLFEAAGWDLAMSEVERDLEVLTAEPVHSHFAAFSCDDLAVHTAWVGHRPDRGQV